VVDSVVFLLVMLMLMVVQPPFDGEDEDDLMTSITDYVISFPRFMSKESITICTAVRFQPQLLTTFRVFICPIAIAYSMGQIIKSFCVCACVCPSVDTLTVAFFSRSRSHF